MNSIDRIEQLRARVAELETALRKCQAFLNEWRDCLAGVQMTEAHFDSTSGVQEASAALARAESAAPDKHPDTEIVDWLEDNTAVPYCAGLYDSSPDAAVEIPGIGVFVGGTLRAAIDAARKALAESAAPLPMRDDPRYRGTDFRSALAAIAKEEATR